MIVGWWRLATDLNSRYRCETEEPSACSSVGFHHEKSSARSPWALLWSLWGFIRGLYLPEGWDTEITSLERGNRNGFPEHVFRFEFPLLNSRFPLGFPNNEFIFLEFKILSYSHFPSSNDASKLIIKGKKSLKLLLSQQKQTLIDMVFDMMKIVKLFC